MKNTASHRLGRPRSFSLEAALDRAIPIFWEKGYEGASFRDLTTAMQISAPSLVAAFGDKRALFNAAVERYAETIASRHLTALQGPGSLRDRLAAFFAAVIVTATGDGKPTGCLVTCALANRAGDDPAASAQLGTMLQTADKALADQFRAAGFTPEQARSRALVAAATMHSIALRARAGASKTELQQISEAAVALLSG